MEHLRIETIDGNDFLIVVYNDRPNDIYTIQSVPARSEYYADTIPCKDCGIALDNGRWQLEQINLHHQEIIVRFTRHCSACNCAYVTRQVFKLKPVEQSSDADFPF